MSAELSWHLCRFAELSVDALYALLRLRDKVFVVEQDSVYGDVDNLDPLAWHVQGLAASGALLAYARVLPPGVKDAQAVCIGRVVVAAAARGLGLGSVVLDQALACVAVDRHEGGRHVDLVVVVHGACQSGVNRRSNLAWSAVSSKLTSWPIFMSDSRQAANSVVLPASSITSRSMMA